MNKSEIPAAQKSVLSILLDDHKEVKKIFKAFESEKDARRKQTMIQEACHELTVHTQIEEQVVYPFLRDAAPDAFADLLDEAVVEHATAKDLIQQLKQGGDQDPLHEAKFTVLGEYVNHHVTEEENELFPKVISKKIELRDLEPQIMKIKKEMQ